MIDLDFARVKAEKLAEACLGGMVRTKPESWLRSDHLEAKNCWLFLKAQGIDFLPNCAESADMAFVVSKRGKEMSVADHHEDMAALQAYLQEVSAYLERRGE